MSGLADRVMYDPGFQAACQDYAHGNGSSGRIAAAAMRASRSHNMLDALKAVQAVRPENWDDDDDAEQAAAWRAVEAAITMATDA